MLCFNSIVNSQADCPAIVTAALATASEACTTLGRNQACYGNNLLQATAHADAPAFIFEQVGDVVSVADIDSLTLSSMNLTDETWGVALMQLQANLPDTLPGQNVTVLLFGDVAITNAVESYIDLEITTTANVNLRLRPLTSEENIISVLPEGETFIANGRLADNSWIRIVTNDNLREVGWVSAEFVTSDNDLETLTVVDADAPLYTPMQAFYFRSSIGNSPCAEAPSGILIQTPEGVGEVSLLINEVNIRLGSTVYLTAGNGVMSASVIEGHAVLTSNGVSQTVPAGTYAEIPLDSSGVALSPPTVPQPYNLADMQALPISVSLVESVSIAPPLPADQIDAAVAALNVLPRSGTWALSGAYTEDTCVASNAGALLTLNVIFTFSEDRRTLEDVDTASGDAAFVFTRTTENIYAGINRYSNGQLAGTYHFTSSTTVTFTSRFVSDDGSCHFLLEGTGAYMG
jgi:hypothetical protein